MIKIVMKRNDEITMTWNASSEKQALEYINASNQGMSISKWNKDPKLNKWTLGDLTVEFVNVDSEMKKEDKLNIINSEIDNLTRQFVNQQAIIQKCEDNLLKLNDDIVILRQQKLNIEKSIGE
jgi:hypothetical protein